MARHSFRFTIWATTILFCFSSILIAQGSVNGRRTIDPASQNSITHDFAVPPGWPAAAANQNPSTSITTFRREEMAIFEAKQEGRLLEAEKLLNTAIARAENDPHLSSSLGSLLNSLADVENRLLHFRHAIAAEKRAVSADQALGARADSRVLMDLEELGAYARYSGDYATFTQAATQQLALARQNPGPQDSHLLIALSTIAMAYHCERRDAEGLKFQAEEVRICEAQEPHSSGCASFLATYYRDNGHPAYAEKLLSRQAGRTPDSIPGFGYGSYLPKVSHLLALSRMYEADHSYDLAVATDRQVIVLIEQTTKDPVQAAAFYDSLGRDLQMQGHDAEAEAAFKRSFDLREKATGRIRDQWIESLSGTPLVVFYEKQGRLSDAEAILKRALADQQGVLNPNDSAIAKTLVQLARIEAREGEYSEAEPLYEQALKIQEADYGPDNPQLIRTLSLYASVERHLRNTEKANALAARAAALRRKITPSPASRP